MHIGVGLLIVRETLLVTVRMFVLPHNRVTEKSDSPQYDFDDQRTLAEGKVTSFMA
jgi:hypothetical protein